MKYPNLMRTAALAAAVGTGSVFAQTAPVITDVGPPPAEDRSSTGAIVLENSLVRAQRDNAFQRSGSQTGVTSVGRGVLRATMKAQREADLAKAREAEAVNLHDRGAGSLIEK
ncbi:hypothetical protein [Caenimonas soli]|uniref:hypothetical protein n=1 Tax=Caenimonas soli TaxID=2735555 RepID=UPI001555FCA5|nr:hypothetical protein [Caenimonas soli]NPC55219.1 hypothetical protein [Caenimonas soli]